MSLIKVARWVTLRPQLDRCCRGEAEVRILDFKTTWSEFQVPSQTAPAEAKPRCVYSILKPHDQSSKGQVRIPSYQVRILSPRQITIPHLRVSSPPQSRSKAVVCVSTPRMYPRSGYFLVMTRKYPLCGYILGVLTQTTTWERHWGGDITIISR